LKHMIASVAVKAREHSGSLDKPAVDFVKGHMGGNEIILLDGKQIPDERLVDVALTLLDHPNIGGDQAAIFSPSNMQNCLRVKIIGRSSRKFISMCGGMTQVLGRALLETDFAQRFNVSIVEPTSEITLETDCGPVLLKIESANGRLRKIWTDMKTYVDECYKLGIHPLRLREVDAMKVGDFLVLNGDEVRKTNSNLDFEEMDEKSLKTLIEIQRAFNEGKPRKSLDFALYDHHPKHGGHVRAVFPHNIPGAHIEPACGTGTVAIGLAMLQLGQIGGNGTSSLLLETGGGPTLGGPDITELKLTTENGKAVGAEFNHSLVEVLATGRCFIGKPRS
jgi:diaminopimelate epimerase